MRQLRIVTRLFGMFAVSMTTDALGSSFVTAQIRTRGPDQSDCASAVSLATEVESRLQRRLFIDATTADLRLDVTYSHEHGQWAAAIELSTQSGQPLGQRRISTEGHECSAMNESLALILALMVDLTQAEVTARVRPEPPPSTTEVHVPIAKTATPRWGATLALAGLARLGLVPGTGWGAELSTGLRHRSRSGMKLGVKALLTSSTADGPTARATFSSYLADFGVCRLVTEPGGLEFSLCVGAELGILRAEGTGYQRGRAERTTLINPYAALETAWWPTAQLALTLGTGVAIPAIRDSFYVTRGDSTTVDLFKPASISPFLHAGIGLQL